MRPLAATRPLEICTDRGNWGFNSSEWVGNGAAVAISNLYYPSDTRRVRDNVQKLLMQIAADAFSNVLKEYWRDWKKKLRRHPAQFLITGCNTLDNQFPK